MQAIPASAAWIGASVIANSAVLFFALGRTHVLRLAQQFARHELCSWLVLTAQKARHGRCVGVLIGLAKGGA